MIKHILVAMDDSPHSWTARQYAVDIARGYDAIVKALTVADTGIMVTPAGWGFDSMPYPWFDPSGRGKAAQTQSLEATCLDLLNKARTMFEEDGVRFRTVYRYGIPDDTIVQESETVDLVVMGHQGRGSSFLDRVMGSTARSVVRRCHKPVFVAPQEHQPLKRVLLAYDGSPHANHALRWTADIATTLKLPVVVLSVHKREGEAAMNVLKAKEYLSAYPVSVTPMSLIQYRHVADEILWVAAEHECNLIVMGAYGHNPLREAVSGSTTEKVMNETAVPLMLVR